MNCVAELFISCSITTKRSWRSGDLLEIVLFIEIIYKLNMGKDPGKVLPEFRFSENMMAKRAAWKSRPLLSINVMPSFGQGVAVNRIGAHGKNK